MTDVPITHAIRGFLLAALVPLVVWCQGCSLTPMERARTTISVSAEAVVAVDRIVTPRYAAALGAGNANPAELARWERVAETLILTRSAILVAEASLDAIEAGGDGDVSRVLACVAASVLRLVDALPEVGVELPEALTLVLGLLGGHAASCEPGAP